MVRKRITIDAVICDICGKQMFTESKCIVCDKDVCYECNPILDLEFKAFHFVLCPEHYRSISLEDFVGRVKKLSKTGE